jgi:hypothetical protein
LAAKAQHGAASNRSSGGRSPRIHSARFASVDEFAAAMLPALRELPADDAGDRGAVTVEA